MQRRFTAIALSLAVATLVGMGLSTAANAQPSYQNPPPGANDFACKPTAAHPRPVLLLHGLSARMGENWRYLSPLLKDRGYCVFALTYGLDPRFPSRGGTIPVQKSAPEIAAFANYVLKTTGAVQLDLVGHSEGTFTPQYWLKYLGGAPKVHAYVAFTPVYDGTQLLQNHRLRKLGGPGADLFLGAFGNVCGFCPEVLWDSAMVRKVRSAAPGVLYTTVMTKYDELVKPYTSGIMEAPGAKNFVLQDVCPTDPVEHLGVAFDPVAAQIAFNALDPEHAKPVVCNGVPGTPPPALARRFGLR